MKQLFGLSLLLLLAACGPVAADPVRTAPARLTVGPVPGGDTEIGRLVRGPAQARYCGGVGFIDLGSATDGPAYFFRRSDGRVLGRCGGYCWDPDQRARCARECPPPAWRCGRR